MKAVEVKGRDPKIAWDIVGVYIAPNEDMGTGPDIREERRSIASLEMIHLTLCGLEWSRGKM
jgi:hypothetical protein